MSEGIPYQVFPNMRRLVKQDQQLFNDLAYASTASREYAIMFYKYPATNYYYKIYNYFYTLENSEQSTETKKALLMSTASDKATQNAILTIYNKYTWILRGFQQFVQVVLLSENPKLQLNSDIIYQRIGKDIEYVVFLINIFEVVTSNLDDPAKSANFDIKNYAEGLSKIYFGVYSVFIIDMCKSFAEMNALKYPQLPELFLTLCHETLKEAYTDETSQYKPCSSENVGYYLMNYSFYKDEAFSIFKDTDKTGSRLDNVCYNIISNGIHKFKQNKYSPCYVINIVNGMMQNMANKTDIQYISSIPNILIEYDSIFNNDPSKPLFYIDNNSESSLSNIFDPVKINEYIKQNIKEENKGWKFLPRPDEKEDVTKEKLLGYSNVREIKRAYWQSQNRWNSLFKEKEEELNKYKEELENEEKRIGELIRQLEDEKQKTSQIETDIENNSVNQQIVDEYLSLRGLIPQTIGQARGQAAGYRFNNQYIPSTEIDERLPLKDVILESIHHYADKLTKQEATIRNHCVRVIQMAAEAGAINNPGDLQYTTLVQLDLLAKQSLENVKQMIINKQSFLVSYQNALNQIYNALSINIQNSSEEQKLSEALSKISEYITNEQKSAQLIKEVDGVFKDLGGLINNYQNIVNANSSTKFDAILDGLIEALTKFVDETINNIIINESKKEIQDTDDIAKAVQENKMVTEMILGKSYFTELISEVSSTSARTYIEKVLGKERATNKLKGISNLFVKLTNGYNQKLDIYKQNLLVLIDEYKTKLAEVELRKMEVEGQSEVLSEQTANLVNVAEEADKRIEMINTRRLEVNNAINEMKEIVYGKDTILNNLFNKLLTMNDYQSLLESFNSLDIIEENIKNINLSEFQKETLKMITTLAKIKIESIIASNSEDESGDSAVIDILLPRIYKPLKAMHLALITSSNDERDKKLLEAENTLDELLSIPVDETKTTKSIKKVLQTIDVLRLGIEQFVALKDKAGELNKTASELSGQINAMKEEFMWIKRLFIEIIDKIVMDYYAATGTVPPDNFIKTEVENVISTMNDQDKNAHPIMINWFIELANNYDQLYNYRKQQNYQIGTDDLFKYVEGQSNSTAIEFNSSINSTFLTLIKQIEEIQQIVSNGEINSKSEKYKKETGDYKIDSTEEVIKREKERIENDLGRDLTQWYEMFLNQEFNAELKEKGRILWERINHMAELSHKFHEKVINQYNMEYTTLKKVQEETMKEEFKSFGEIQRKELISDLSMKYKSFVVSAFSGAVNLYEERAKDLREIVNKSYKLLIISENYNVDGKITLKEDEDKYSIHDLSFINASKCYDYFLDLMNLLLTYIELNKNIINTDLNLEDIVTPLLYKLKTMEYTTPFNIIENTRLDYKFINDTNNANGLKVTKIRNDVINENIFRKCLKTYQTYRENYIKLIKLMNDNDYSINTIKELQGTVYQLIESLRQLKQEYVSYYTNLHKNAKEIEKESDYVSQELFVLGEGDAKHSVHSIKEATNILSTITVSLESMKMIEVYVKANAYQKAIEEIDNLSKYITEKTLLGITYWKFTFVSGSGNVLVKNSLILARKTVELLKEKQELEEKKKFEEKLLKQQNELNDLQSKYKTLIDTRDSLLKEKKEMMDQIKNKDNLLQEKIKKLQELQELKESSEASKLQEEIEKVNIEKSKIATNLNECTKKIDDCVKDKSEKEIIIKEKKDEIMKEVNDSEVSNTFDLAEVLSSFNEENADLVDKYDKSKTEEEKKEIEAKLEENKNNNIKKVTQLIKKDIKKDEGKIDKHEEKLKNASIINGLDISKETAVENYGFSIESSLSKINQTPNSITPKYVITNGNIYGFLKNSYSSIKNLSYIITQNGFSIDSSMSTYFGKELKFLQFLEAYSNLLKYIEAVNLDMYQEERYELAQKIMNDDKEYSILSSYSTAFSIDTNKLKEIKERIVDDSKNYNYSDRLLEYKAIVESYVEDIINETNADKLEKLITDEIKQIKEFYNPMYDKEEVNMLFRGKNDAMFYAKTVYDVDTLLYAILNISKKMSEIVKTNSLTPSRNLLTKLKEITNTMDTINSSNTRKLNLPNVLSLDLGVAVIKITSSEVKEYEINLLKEEKNRSERKIVQELKEVIEDEDSSDDQIYSDEDEDDFNTDDKEFALLKKEMKEKSISRKTDIEIMEKDFKKAGIYNIQMQLPNTNVIVNLEFNANLTHKIRDYTTEDKQIELIKKSFK